MASQTKVGSSDRSASSAPGSSVGVPSRAVESETQASDVATPASTVSSVASAGSGSGDDEDVSLDELMMSDSSEPGEEQDVAPAHTAAEAAAPASTRTDASASGEPSFEVTLPEDDEAAARAAAAAAQEAAAQAAAAEAVALEAAARLATAARPHSAEALRAPASEDTPGDGAPAERRSSAPPARASAAPPPADVEDTEPPPSVELEPSDLEPPSAVTAPEAVEAPLPSFDIPEPVSGARARDSLPGRNRATPLTHLSEVAEDDDDAVTHIGLPVVPEGPAEAYAGPGGELLPPEPGLVGAEPDFGDSRRAATRLVPRLDPALVASRQRLEAQSSPALPSQRIGGWLSGWFRRRRVGAGGHEELPAAPRRGPAGTLFDTILPPLSLVLFGSGLGAGIIQLVTQPERGARAAEQAQAIQALQEAPPPKLPRTLAERAESGDGDALFKITSMPPGERTSALTLALERGYQAQKQNEFREFTKALEEPSGLAMPNLAARFLGFATSPETMLPAFSHLLTWSGSTGPDVLYTVWEKAPGGSRAASLAQQLLHSADQRAKATPALLTALDLRSATSCEQYLRVLPAVKRDGDQRCSATLRALKHRDGCGDDGQKDCFPCLREGTLLDDALAAIEGRRPPPL